MSGVEAGLAAHLASGVTTVCRCWALERRDGLAFGFTDHDAPLSFDGLEFLPDAGLSATALEQGTGLAVDNAEAAGILSHDGIAEEDILAGRYDGAGIRCWLVNWAAPAQRQVLFRGTLGEITRAGGAFRAELRGLTEALNVPHGRVFQKRCGAVLGDAACGVDPGQPGLAVDTEIASVEEGVALRLAGDGGVEEGWFAHGRLVVLSGAAEGGEGRIKSDRRDGGRRWVGLWQSLRGLQPGDRVRVDAGCDKRAETCRAKFSNFNNFRGFPQMPGEDWLMAYPVRSDRNDGGSREA